MSFTNSISNLSKKSNIPLESWRFERFDWQDSIYCSKKPWKLLNNLNSVFILNASSNTYRSARLSMCLFVSLSVCLYVCLLDRIEKKNWRKLGNLNPHTDISCTCVITVQITLAESPSKCTKMKTKTKLTKKD